MILIVEFRDWGALGIATCFEVCSLIDLFRGQQIWQSVGNLMIDACFSDFGGSEHFVTCSIKLEDQ